jgi:1-acyl-sn-glycerol-3-phosphate acyltransferase
MAKPIKTRKIKKPLWYLRPVIVVGSLFFTIFRKIKVRKINCENLKWPYIIFASHAAFLDFPMNANITFPHHVNYISSNEEFVGREWLFYGAGCFPKRKFTKDTTVVKNVLRVTKKLKNGVTVYPEARYSLIGINERIDGSLGKMVKAANVPAVVMITNGNFIHQPQWRKQYKMNNPHEIVFKCVATLEEVQTLPAEEIQKRIEEAFVYDDYKWQLDNKIKIKSKHRAHNIHKVLYKCPHCNKDYAMRSEGSKLYCAECGVTYEMNEYGELICQSGEGKFTHAPDWYRWEREEVKKEVLAGSYYFEDVVRIEHLDNYQVGYNPIGNIRFVHDMNGLHLHGILDNGEEFNFDSAPENTPSIHIDYDYKKRGTKKRGQALDINTIHDTWFIFPQTKNEVVTKIHFAVEALYDLHTKK